MTPPKEKPYSKMTRDELGSRFVGPSTQRTGFRPSAIRRSSQSTGSYFQLYDKGLSQKKLLKELGMEAEYKQYQASQPYKYGDETRTRWTWERLIEKANAIKTAEGTLPPALWFLMGTVHSFKRFTTLDTPGINCGKRWGISLKQLCAITQWPALA